MLAAPDHRAVADRAAERSAVILSNEGGLLPLSRDLKSIAVLGPFADAARDTSGPWIFRQDDAELERVAMSGSARQLRRAMRAVTFAMGLKAFRGDPFFALQRALLHKTADGRSSPSPGQTYPTTFVTGMPRAV